MKKIYLLSLVTFAIICFTAIAKAQTITLTLQPDSTCGKDAFVWDAPGFANATINYGSRPSIVAHAWTNSGQADRSRTLIHFDLGTIPTNAVITGALLSLYNDPSSISFSGQHQTISGPNDGFIQRITSPWSEHTVTWNSQPTSTIINQVIVPASTSPNQDYPNMDVTALVSDMIADPVNSYGFMIRLQTETPYRALVFASSENPTIALHPKLEITYTIPASSVVCINLKTDVGCNKDAMVWNAPGFSNGTTNYGEHPNILAHAWTNNGTPDTSRSLLYFDLSTIPVNSTVISAYFSLFNDPLSNFNNGQHSNLTGPAIALLQRITSYWDENIVNWFSQPTSTTQNQVTLNAPTNLNQNYTNIDVTYLVQDMVNNPLLSYGFMLRLLDETNYRALVFASGNNSNSNLLPSLQVCYSTTVGVQENQLSDATLSVYPNPVNDKLTIHLGVIKMNGVEIYNSMGEIVVNEKINSNVCSVNATNLQQGIYLIRCVTNKGIINKRIVIAAKK